jgi:hypothetical protein
MVILWTSAIEPRRVPPGSLFAWFLRMRIKDLDSCDNVDPFQGRFRRCEMLHGSIFWNFTQ